MSDPKLRTIWARWGLDPLHGLIDGVEATLRGRQLVSWRPAPTPPTRHTSFAPLILTPGLLNAHVHLDYSWLRGRLPRGAGFVPWLTALVAQMQHALESPAQTRQAASSALEQLLHDGVTALFDIDTFGHGRALLDDLGLRSFVELLSPDPVHAGQDWQRFESRLAPPAPAPAGISPHSTYTVCEPNLVRASRLARDRALPLAIHLAESPEENQLLLDGTGPLHELLSDLAGAPRSSVLGVGRSAIQRAHDAALLTPFTLAIHCNLPAPRDLELLAASGAVVVCCPSSHAFFGYPPYPLELMRRAGVRLALGTDSLASNDALSVRRELCRFQTWAASWSPCELLAVATGFALGPTPPFGARGTLDTAGTSGWALWRLDKQPRGDDLASLLEAWLEPDTRLVQSSCCDGKRLCLDSDS